MRRCVSPVVATMPRSCGCAVLNAMARLTAVGVAVLTSEAPVKYALADDAPAPSADVESLMTRPMISTDDEPTPADNEAPAELAAAGR